MFSQLFSIQVAMSIFLLSAGLASIHAQAGTKESHGGAVKVCTLPNGLLSAEILDRFEGREWYGLQIPKDPSPYLDQTKRALERIPYSALRAEALQELKHITETMKPFGQDISMSKLLPDSYPLPIRQQSCDPMPRNIAVYTAEGEVRYDQGLWSALEGEIDRAMILTHEVTYKLLRDRFDLSSSIPARKLTAYLHSTATDDDIYDLFVENFGSETQDSKSIATNIPTRRIRQTIDELQLLKPQLAYALSIALKECKISRTQNDEYPEYFKILLGQNGECSISFKDKFFASYIDQNLRIQTEFEALLRYSLSLDPKGTFGYDDEIKSIALLLSQSRLEDSINQLSAWRFRSGSSTFSVHDYVYDQRVYDSLLSSMKFDTYTLWDGKRIKLPRLQESQLAIARYPQDDFGVRFIQSVIVQNLARFAQSEVPHQGQGWREVLSGHIKPRFKLSYNREKHGKDLNISLSVIPVLETTPILDFVPIEHEITGTVLVPTSPLAEAYSTQWREIQNHVLELGKLSPKLRVSRVLLSDAKTNSSFYKILGSLGDIWKLPDSAVSLINRAVVQNSLVPIDSWKQNFSKLIESVDFVAVTLDQKSILDEVSAVVAHCPARKWHRDLGTMAYECSQFMKGTRTINVTLPHSGYSLYQSQIINDAFPRFKDTKKARLSLSQLSVAFVPEAVGKTENCGFEGEARLVCFVNN